MGMYKWREMSALINRVHVIYTKMFSLKFFIPSRYVTRYETNKLSELEIAVFLFFSGIQWMDFTCSGVL